MKNNSDVVLVLLFLLLLSTIAPRNIVAQAPDRSFSLTLDSGYFGKLPSNRPYETFGLELSAAVDETAEWIYSRDFMPKSRWVRIISLMFIEYRFISAFRVSYHEWGHFTRFEAIGYPGRLQSLDLNTLDKDKLDEVDILFETDNFWSFFQYVLKGEVGQYVTSYINEREFDREWPEDWEILIVGGGLNNDMRMAEAFERVKYLDGSKVSGINQFYQYIINKLSGFLYVYSESSMKLTGDPSLASDLYRKKGYNFTTGTIQTASLASLFGSATLYQGFEKTRVEIAFDDAENYKIRIPDLAYYLNRDGLSYKLSSGLRYRENWTFPVSFEWIVRGDDHKEFGLGCQYSQTDWRGLIEFKFSNSITYTGKARYFPWDRLRLELGLTHYALNSLHGERNIPSLEKGDTFNEFWTAISYLY